MRRLKPLADIRRTNGTDKSSSVSSLKNRCGISKNKIPCFSSTAVLKYNGRPLWLKYTFNSSSFFILSVLKKTYSSCILYRELGRGRNALLHKTVRLGRSFTKELKIYSHSILLRGFCIVVSDKVGRFDQPFSFCMQGRDFYKISCGTAAWGTAEFCGCPACTAVFGP